jgi:menaquinol-cytochrome c reductase iron-sulfur subunit
MADDPDRRKALKLATYGIGAGIGAAVGLPVLSLVVDPAGKQTVTTPKDPIDLGSVERLPVGPAWTKYDVIAPLVRDAWTTQHDVILGAAWLRRTSEQQVQALSGTCPHLGCVVGWDDAKKNFLCPCHDSRWTDAGEVVPGSGPAKRALDELPIEVKDGRLRLTWRRYQLDTSDRKPV